MLFKCDLFCTELICYNEYGNEYGNTVAALWFPCYKFELDIKICCMFMFKTLSIRIPHFIYEICFPFSYDKT